LAAASAMQPRKEFPAKSTGTLMPISRIDRSRPSTRFGIFGTVPCGNGGVKSESRDVESNHTTRRAYEYESGIFVVRFPNSRSERGNDVNIAMHSETTVLLPGPAAVHVNRAPDMQRDTQIRKARVLRFISGVGHHPDGYVRKGPLRSGECNLRAFGEDAQSGRGIERATRRAVDFLCYIVACIRALCAIIAPSALVECERGCGAASRHIPV
jgi:hypothetical protein